MNCYLRGNAIYSLEAPGKIESEVNKEIEKHVKSILESLRGNEKIVSEMQNNFPKEIRIDIKIEF